MGWRRCRKRTMTRRLKRDRQAFRLPATKRRELERDALAVEASAPAQLPDRIVSSRPLVFQQGLGLPVADLLLPELPDRLAAVMPDDGGRRVADESPAVPEPPAHIDVV